MLSIKNNNKYEYLIKNSKFISLLYKVDNKEEIKKIIKEVKEKYPNATHYCYAYILDSETKTSDDKEPSSSAGLPILNQLKTNNLDHTLLIVVRYFGGTKLGLGPLTRTYSKVAKEVINKDNIIELTKGYNITLLFKYEDKKKIDYLLKDSQITKKEYQDNITYIANVNKETLTNLQNYNIKINKEIYIEK